MNIIWLDRVDSTNSEALRRLPQLSSETILAAREQTAGRGQRGNTWQSEPGKNLTFSIVLKFAPSQLPADRVHWLNYLISQVIAIFLRSFGVGCDIKWPNDIYVQRHKICGILVENSLNGDWVENAVIGVGLNINQREFPDLVNATSLIRCYGKEQDLDRCLEKIADIFASYYPMLFNERDRAALFSGYSYHLFAKDRNARYHDYLRDVEFWGIIEGVSLDGRLCIKDLESPGKPVRQYRFKEVGFVL